MVAQAPLPVPVRTEDGVTVHLDSYGPTDAPVTVVFLHGWTLDRRIWHHQIAELPGIADTPVRLVAYDHRGHGRSGPTPADRMTIAQLGDDLAGVLAAAVPDGRVVLAGHSIGGMTIMALAERHPDLVANRVAGVAFVNTSCGDLADPDLGLPRPAARLFARAERAVGERLLRPEDHGRLGRTLARGAQRMTISRTSLRRLLFGDRPSDAAVRLIASTVAATPPETIAGFRATFADHDRRAALAALREIPVRILGGAADRLCPPRHARAIHAELPHAEFAVYPGAGHMLPLERPRDVTGHLARLVGG